MSGPSRRVFTGVGLLSALLTPWKVSRADEPGGKDGPELTLKELSAQLGRLQRRYESLTHDFTIRSLLDPPVGSILAFAGAWPPPNPAVESAYTEAELGWLLCDGRPFSDATFETIRPSLEHLGKVLGTADKPATSLPNYQGYFLRGFDPSGNIDKGQFISTTARTPRALGAVQEGTTKRPTEQALVADAAGKHSHLIPTWVTSDGGGLEIGLGGFAKYDYISSPPTSEVDPHGHTISGGDAETRPINVAVHYIVRFRGAPGL